MKSRVGELSVVLATFLAALGWVSSKQVVSLMPAAQFIGLRFLVAAMVLLPFCLSALRKVNVSTLLRSLGLGVILAVHLLLWIYAVSISISIGEGAFIMSLAMIFAPIVRWAIFSHKPPAAFWFALPLALLGIAFLSLASGWQLDESQLYFALSAVLLSLHFNLNKQLTTQLKPIALVCSQLFSVGVVSLLASLLFADSSENEMTSTGWLWFGVAVFCATSFRYFLQTFGQSNTNTGTASLLMTFELIWTLLLSVMMFGELLPLSKVFGCGFIIGSLLVYRLGEQWSEARLPIKKLTS